MPLIKNKIFIYLVTRYLTYGLQFALSLIVAVRLGPYYLGVYGVLQLVLSYFAQVNFGIPHSLNVLLVHNKSDNDIQDKYTLNSFAIYTFWNVVVVIGALFVVLFGYTQWGEYDIEIYFSLIILIAILTYYNSIVLTVIRFRNQVNNLSLIGSIPVIGNLLVVWFFNEEELVVALTVVNFFSCILISTIGFINGAIPKIYISKLNVDLQKGIIHKGLYLFLYNSCFYFILIAVRTIIGSNYSVEEFGFFTFSYTIANAVMLMLDSLNTIIFPKIIDMLSVQNKEQKAAVLDKLRVSYITTSHMLVYFAMILFPFLVLFFPKYEPALTSMNMISLAVLMNANSYGYNTLLIAQNKEIVSSKISANALFIAIVIGLLLVKVVHVEYSFVIISMLIAYMIFSILATYEGTKLLKDNVDFFYVLKHFFPIKMFIPYVIALAISIFRLESIIFIPFLIFITLNYKDLGFLKNILMKMVKNPNIIDL